MRAIGFPDCCGAAIFSRLYDEDLGNPQICETLGPQIRGIIEPTGPDGTPLKPDSMYVGLVHGSRRSVAIAITSPVEEKQRGILRENGARVVAEFINYNGGALLTVWAVPLLKGYSKLRIPGDAYFTGDK